MDTIPTHRSPIDRRQFLRWGGLAAGAVALGPTLAACGQPTTTPSGTGSTGATEVVFACTKLPGSISLQAWVDEYNTSQGKYKVTVRELPPPGSNTEVHQQIVQSLSRKDGSIDVFSEDIIWISEFANAGWTMKLDGKLDAANLQDSFPGVVSGCTYKGSLSAVPWFVDAGQLYYRNDLISRDEVPTQWEQLADLASKLQSSGKVDYGFLWQAKQAEILVCDLVEYVASAGGSILGDDSVTVNIANEPAINAVQFMYDLINKYKVTPKDVLSWDEEPSRRPFTSGQAAMLRQWSYVYGVSQTEDQSSVVGKVGVAPLPAFSGGKSAACLGGFQLGVSDASKNKDGALDFLNWAMKPETQIGFAKNFGNAPIRSSVYEDATFKQQQPAMSQLKAVFEGGTPRPVTPKYPQVSLALQSSVSKALNSGDIAGELQKCAAELQKIVTS
ncbi:MAG TPA: extracellular solute-binding protein [Propionibacteriaceae bacterium]